MFSIRAVFFAAASYVLLFALIGVAVRALLPAWWKLRTVRVGLAVGVVITLVSLFVWGGGSVLRVSPLQQAGVRVAWSVLAFVLPLAVAVPIAGILSRILILVFARRPKAPPEGTPGPPVSRRELIQWGTAVLPVAAMAGSTLGLVSATLSPALVRVPLRFDTLPDALRGLRILQLTDLHLGVYRKVADVARVIEQVAGDPPDLILITGDVADDLAQLGPALSLAASLKPRLGVFAAPGNHEYFHRIADVRRIFDKSPVPLLLEMGTKIDVGGATLYVAGAGDPVSLRGDPRAFLERSIDAALSGAPSDAFHLLMSHRPAGFDVAAERGVSLTLSGHTHGAQVGAFGRSAFEPLMPGRYLRGAYAQGKSRLYTSAGFGHWFPFRLGCAAEAPTIVLTT